MVKHENFKTCDQSGFCKRNRRFADAASASTWKSPYRLDKQSIRFDKGVLTGTVLKQLKSDLIRLPLTITFLESGLARVTIDEEQRLKGEIVLRHDSKAQRRRYNEAEKWAISGDLTPSKDAALGTTQESGVTRVRYGGASKFEAIVHHSPFSVEFNRDGQTHVEFNERGLFNIEHWRQKRELKEGEEAPPDAEDESTWWEESFGGNTDSKPRGPEAVGLDITFHGYEHVYGIPEHASSLSLKETTGGEGKYSEPYRLYNTDVFEYEVDSPMTLYGAIPFMQAHRADSTVGIFWLSGAETWIDVAKTKSKTNPMALGIKGETTTRTHWYSESGILDVFVFLGPTPKDVITSYAELTGTTQLPQEFSIAYHQCRWNYVTDEDVIDVAKRFDRHNIPFDVLWLDIEYTDGKKYFTWDPLNFDDPESMHTHLDKAGRELVVIIDPHIKNEGGYAIVDQLKSKDLAIKNKDSAIYEGWCWPGSSHWVDCFNPAAVTWWKTLFKYDTFKGTFPNTFLWNDMNEPSVFNGPETTMPKDNLHFGNWEHRDVHNINAMTFHNATYQALLSRSKAEEKTPRRPFVLTRGFFAGSQRTSAVWTGDNLSAWSHLAASIPMILTNGISGYPFIGADVGGFFGNPSKELLTRWYQAGAFYPFFRAHAHIDTRRREPYLAGEPYQTIITQALRLRYALLPAWYTAFHQASVTGEPIVRPNFYVHPTDEAGFGIDDQMYLGATGLLVKPVVEEGGEKVDIYLADNEVYYDYFDFSTYSGKGRHTIAAPLEKLPLLMRGGHIFPRRDRVRRSSALMKFDPVTLVVVLPKAGDAEGEIYLDDGDTFEYEQGAYIHRRFAFSVASNTLSSEDVGEKGKLTDRYLKTMEKVRVEKVIVVGAPDSWAGKKEVKVSAEGGASSGGKKKAAMSFHKGQKGQANWAIVKDPAVGIGKGWKIEF